MPEVNAPDLKQERTYAMMCHLSALAGYLMPLGNIIGPLVVWLIKKDQSALVDAEGKKALNFQISILIYLLVAGILCLVLIGFALLVVIGIFELVMVIVAAVKTSNGEQFNYPLSITFLR